MNASSPAAPLGSLLAGVVADAVFADPATHHPVAWFGSYATAVEKRSYADSRTAGALYVAACVAPPVAAAWLVERFAPTPLRAVVFAAAVWTSLGGTTLARIAGRIDERLMRGDLDGARELLPWLVARDPAHLDAAGVARAVVESVAENTSDAVTAPLLWAAWAGLPGVVAYRCTNTLDAMVGYRTARHRNFGYAAARLDDIINVLPARITALALVAAAPVVNGSPAAALAAWQRDAAAHESPNAGPVEAATAGALGVRLGGRNIYGTPGDTYISDRAALGMGEPPAREDIARVVRLTRAATGVVIAGIVVTGLAGRAWQRGRHA